MSSKSLIAVLVVGALILTAGTALARPGYDDRMYIELTSTQEAKIVQLSTEYQKEISPLIEEEHAKKMEFYALSNYSGLQTSEQLLNIEILSKEIAEINTELRGKKIEFEEMVYKKTGVYMSGGMHHGSMCSGRGSGYMGDDI